MKVLCLNPPQVPSYFNAGHHLPIFQVSAYLRAHGVTAVEVRDFAALNASWRDVCDLLVREFDVIVILNDFDSVDTFDRTVYYVRHLAPHARIVTFGRLSKQIPGWFTRFDIDAIVASGDYEIGVLAALTATEEPPPGLWLRYNGEFRKGKPGLMIPPEDWVFPDVMEIPYGAYQRMYANDLNKFCGIPARQELVVPAARGCPVGCAFCDVPKMQGRRERRISVERTVSYIVDSFARLPFEYVSFYVPTFTIDRSWVFSLCEALRREPRSYPWKCVTTLSHLDEELISAMSFAGCVRISVGLETLNPEGQDSLPKIKRSHEQQFELVTRLCAKYGVELNCFIIVGLPGDDPEGARHTIEIVRKAGARIRPTAYTPYDQMRDDMSALEISKFNRQLLRLEDVPLSHIQYYHHLLFANKLDQPTQVAERIARHEGYGLP